MYLDQENLSDLLDDEARYLINPDGKGFSKGRRRATDQKNNCDVIMPGPAPAMTEAGHNTQVGIWQDVFGRIMKKICNKDGRQSKRNLMPGQEKALKSLGKRVSKAEIIIMEADKGKKFIVYDEPTYIAMATDHTSKDLKVSREEVTASQRILTSTARVMTNVFQTGMSQSYNNYVRCMENVSSQAEDPPTMKVLPKLHKSPTPQGHPQKQASRHCLLRDILESWGHHR